MIRKMLNTPAFWQLFRFGVVGSVAAAVNFLVVVLLVEALHWHPLWANVLAFACAYQVSFSGHHFWTFANQPRRGRFPWVKFLLVAGLSFLLNEGLFFVFLHWVGLYYIWALLCVLIVVPPLTFVCSKFWAFR